MSKTVKIWLMTAAALVALGGILFAGVMATSHYEVRDNGALAVLALAYYYASAGIGIGGEELGELCYIVNACHLVNSFH